MIRRRVLGAARRAGLERQIRTVQYVVSSHERRRDWRDNRHIQLLLAYTLSPDSNCIDVGASEGTVLRQMTRLAPLGQHFAFEPLPELAATLRDEFPAVEVRQSALFDVEGTRTFYRVRDAHWYSSLEPMGRPASKLGRLSVAVERLDDVLPSSYVPSLIKVDVEGAEAGVLAGALKTLQRHQPIVVFEHGRHAAHFPDADLFSLLTDAAGLRVFDIDGGGPYDRECFSARIRRGDLWTFVARP
jgi:FkbM family methyltransferase